MAVLAEKKQRSLQPSNAIVSIPETLSPPFTFLKLVQFPKARTEIRVTEDGMYTVTNISLPAKADAPIATTFSGI